MKHKQLIVAALIATTLLSGCGNQSTEVMAPVESQVETTTPAELTVPENWWENKLYQDTTTGTGMYFWVELLDNHLFFLVSGIPNKDYAECVGYAVPDDYKTYDETHVQFNVESDLNTIVLYSVTDDQIVLYTDANYGGINPSLVYDQVMREEPQEQEQHTETEQPDLSNNTEFPEFSNWECFETFSGEDIKISIEVQSGDPVMILPEAQFIILERNGADTGWEFINEDFTDTRVYTTVTYYGDKLVISSTEDWKWDGTYTQLPDTTE